MLYRLSFLSYDLSVFVHPYFLQLQHWLHYQRGHFQVLVVLYSPNELIYHLNLEHFTAHVFHNVVSAENEYSAHLATYRICESLILQFVQATLPKTLLRLDLNGVPLRNSQHHFTRLYHVKTVRYLTSLENNVSLLEFELLSQVSNLVLLM